MILPGFENLRAQEVTAFTGDGCALVKDGDKTKRYQMFIDPSGSFVGRPENPGNAPIDQLAVREPTPISSRWRGVDQAS